MRSWLLRAIHPSLFSGQQVRGETAELGDVLAMLAEVFRIADRGRYQPSILKLDWTRDDAGWLAGSHLGPAVIGNVNELPYDRAPTPLVLYKRRPAFLECVEAILRSSPSSGDEGHAEPGLIAGNLAQRASNDKHEHAAAH